MSLITSGENLLVGGKLRDPVGHLPYNIVSHFKPQPVHNVIPRLTLVQGYVPSKLAQDIWSVKQHQDALAEQMSARVFKGEVNDLNPNIMEVSMGLRHRMNKLQDRTSSPIRQNLSTSKDHTLQVQLPDGSDIKTPEKTPTIVTKKSKSAKKREKKRKGKAVLESPESPTPLPTYGEVEDLPPAKGTRSKKQIGGKNIFDVLGVASKSDEVPAI